MEGARMELYACLNIEGIGKAKNIRVNVKNVSKCEKKVIQLTSKLTNFHIKREINVYLFNYISRRK